jgi:hypothetical protein
MTKLKSVEIKDEELNCPETLMWLDTIKDYQKWADRVSADLKSPKATRRESWSLDIMQEIQDAEKEIMEISGR